MPLSVLVLAGSSVDEFHGDLSRVYASGFLSAMVDASHRFQVAWVDPGGRWRFPDGLEPADIAAASTMPLAEAVEVLIAGEFDLMVPQMFCLPGMTTYRSLFDLMGVPYVGNGPDLMALTADKSRARAVVAAAAVDVPRGVVVRPGDSIDADLLPAVVKPVDADNSAGVMLVRDEADLDRAVAGALEHSSAALVESYVPLGREVRCGILVRDGELICLPLEEYAVDDIRTPADKLDRTADGDLYLVAKEQTRAWIVPLDDPLTERVWAAARASHQALGCRHYSLFDFRIDPDGTPWFLEASLYCSYSPSSVLAVMAAAAGIDVVDLLDVTLKDIARPVGHGP